MSALASLNLSPEQLEKINADVQHDIAELTRLEPDWQRYEARMLRIAQHVQPERGQTGLGYLRELLQLARASSRPLAG